MLSLNLKSDWAELLVEYLSLSPSQRAQIKNPWELTAATLNAERLYIEPRPRVIKKARGFAESEKLRAFFESVERGDDLNKQQSRRYKPAFNDRLLNDLRIRHFHLTRADEHRVDQLLFAVVKPDVFYAIAMLGHETFEVETLVEDVHQNWPEILTEFIAPGVIPGSYDGPEPPERGPFRKLGITTAIQVSDGTIYLSPGGGLVSGGLAGNKGLSLEVVGEANRAMNYLVDLEQAAQAASERLERMIDTAEKSLRLAYRDGILFGITPSGKTAIRLGPSPLQLRVEPGRWLPKDTIASSATFRPT